MSLALTGAMNDAELCGSWWDPDSGCTVVVARPSAAPELWQTYVGGARQSYRSHGVECALDLAALSSGSDTALFFVALDGDGRMRGGLRVRQPYRVVADSHAVLEWDGQPGLRAIKAMIGERIPDGVVEVKSAWVSHEPGPHRGLARSLARTALPILHLLDARYLMATAADHVLQAWCSSGGRVAEHIPATPYPDKRYATKVMWWDRTTITSDAESAQAAKMLTHLHSLRQDTLAATA